MEKAKKLNPAADPRKMRRIIAEDPEWNLETVPPLVDACIQHIITNFHSRPLLDELLPKDKQKVLDKLPTNVPLKVTAPLVNDDSYWERCCRARWTLCDVGEYQSNWKKMYFERNAQECVENFVPEQSSIQDLEEVLQLSSPFVHRLVVRQLLPPPRDKPIGMDDDEADGMSEDTPLKPCNDHLDCGIILKHLKHLEELQLVFGVQRCGMNFEWSLFDFTKQDCQLLSKGLKATPTIKLFRLNKSKANDDRGRLLVSHLLDHPSLQTLDLSHNKLSDGSGRALAKLLNGHCPNLSVLNISNNTIGPLGGVSLGRALQVNVTLKELDLRMNTLGDEGIQPILKALLKNSTLVILNIGSNNIGEPSAPALSELLMTNKTLSSLNIACNKVGEAGGRLIQEGMEDNKTLVTFDLRLTDITQESEYCINQIVKTNKDKLTGRSR